MRDAGRLLTRKSNGALRLGNTVHQPVPSMLRRGYIVQCGERKHPRTGAVVHLYRRTDLGERVSLIYARTVRALYSAQWAEEPPVEESDGAEGVALPPPVTSRALILEFLRAGNMSATQLARHYAHTAGSALREARAKFQHGVTALRRLGLIEEFYQGAQHILYNLTLAGERRAERSFLRRAVHPHVRGDDEARTWQPPGRAGAPPRAWGRRRSLVDGGREGRCTPTCVGTTARSGRTTERSTVHPHVRGDDDRYRTDAARVRGAPPRAWGRLRSQPFHDPAHRCTPTCVGTTGRTPGRRTASSVHPHVRGDDERRDQARDVSRGAPPRAWGRLTNRATRSGA